MILQLVLLDIKAFGYFLLLQIKAASDCRASQIFTASCFCLGYHAVVFVPLNKRL